MTDTPRPKGKGAEMGRASRRKHRTTSIGQMFGVELFEDSRLLRLILCQAHYDTVDDCADPPFPLADVNDPTTTNANIVIYWLRQHKTDARVILVHHHRYFHRDSQDPSDGLDLKRTHAVSALMPTADEVEEMVQSFCRFIATDDRAGLCAPPAVYDFSAAPIQVALKALIKLPFMHTRVFAPDGGVQ